MLDFAVNRGQIAVLVDTPLAGLGERARTRLQLEALDVNAVAPFSVPVIVGRDRAPGMVAIGCYAGAVLFAPVSERKLARIRLAFVIGIQFITYT